MKIQLKCNQATLVLISWIPCRSHLYLHWGILNTSFDKMLRYLQLLRRPNLHYNYFHMCFDLWRLRGYLFLPKNLHPNLSIQTKWQGHSRAVNASLQLQFHSKQSLHLNRISILLQKFHKVKLFQEYSRNLRQIQSRNLGTWPLGHQEKARLLLKQQASKILSNL